MINSEEIADIAINVLFVATFLGVFFFTVAAGIEGEVVKDQVKYLVNDFTSNLDMLPDQYLNILRNKLIQSEQPNLTEIDQKVQESNNDVFSTAMMLLTITLVIGLICVHIASRYYGFDMWHLLKRNLLILVFIGLTEYTFLMIFGRNYISADPNFVKLTLLNKLTSF